MIETPADTVDMLAFIGASPTPFHCVAEARKRLEAAGFTALAEQDRWAPEPGGGYYVVRDGALIAFRPGQAPPVESGFRLIGAHTDSPDLRVKPQPNVTRAGYAQLGVEVYGGALSHTWLDRDLGLAGRVLLRGKAGLEERRIHIARPILRVPSLAIHLHRELREEGLKLNEQKHLPPVLGLASREGGGDEATSGALERLLAGELEVTPESFASWDLSAVDTVPPAIGGMDGEFVLSPRLDNQASCHAALVALLRAGERAPDAPGTSLVCLYDHEEVGSASTGGAAGAFAESVLARLVELRGTSAPASDVARAAARSFHISCDAAHAVHPNWEDRHEPEHHPKLNGGPVIKLNAKQRYATTARTSARFEALCEEAGVTCQRFVNRTDMRCGSTIGPLASTRLGVDTVDVGNALLSMHSIREQGGVADQPPMIEVLTRFLIS